MIENHFLPSISHRLMGIFLCTLRKSGCGSNYWLWDFCKRWFRWPRLSSSTKQSSKEGDISARSSLAGASLSLQPFTSHSIGWIRSTLGRFLLSEATIFDRAVLYNRFLSDLMVVNFSRNKVVGLGASTASSVIMFRCVEAMYGTSPEFAELSISNYCTYYSCMVRIRICRIFLCFDLTSKSPSTQSKCIMSQL